MWGFSGKGAGAGLVQRKGVGLDVGLHFIDGVGAPAVDGAAHQLGVRRELAGEDGGPVHLAGQVCGQERPAHAAVDQQEVLECPASAPPTTPTLRQPLIHTRQQEFYVAFTIGGSGVASRVSSTTTSSRLGVPCSELDHGSMMWWAHGVRQDWRCLRRTVLCAPGAVCEAVAAAAHLTSGT